MTTTSITSGQTSSGGTFGSADTLDVLSGGKVIGPVLNGGSEHVFSGGTAISTLVSGGQETIDAGGMASATIINSGLEFVYGSASGTTVNAGGNQLVYDGGTTVGTIINAGGEEFVYSGGAASGTIVDGGSEQVYAIGDTFGTVINAGLEFVMGGGRAYGTTVSGTPGGGFGTEVVYGGTTIGTMVDGGQEEVYAGGVTSSATVNAGGFEVIHSGGVASATVVNDSGNETVSLGGNASLTFVNSGGTEELLSGGAATLTDLHVGGTIDITYLAFAQGGSASVSAGDVLTVSVGGATYMQELSGDYTNVGFQVTSDGSGGTDITAEVAPCYCRGTRILTDRGEVAVEDLRAGDRAVTCAGFGAWMKPIVWVGHTKFDATRHPRPLEVWPIRIREGAFDEGLPWRDLLVSPGHSFLIDGVLIQAEKLVNGITILRDPTITRGEYFHVELEQHDALLAEGVPAESYLDTGNRRAFANSRAFHELYPDFSGKAWTSTCAPLVMSGPELAAAKARILARAMALGHVTGADPDMHLLLEDGRRVDPDLVIGDCHRFTLPRPATPRLASRIWTPGDMFDSSNDGRTLGVRVCRVLLDGFRRVSLEDPTIAWDGWHPKECADQEVWRWTSGLACLPRAARSVTVEVIPGGAYWQDPARRDSLAAA